MENSARNWNHICQNVPVNTAADWAREVVKFCRGELEMSPFSFLKQDNVSQRIVQKEDPVKMEIKEEVLDDALLQLNIPMFEGFKVEIKKETPDEADYLQMKTEVKSEVKTEVKSEVKSEVKRSFNHNYSQFLTDYKPTDILPSPEKKIKYEEEVLEIELDDEEVEYYLEGVVKEEEGMPFRCGVCLEDISKLKEMARQHVEECHLAHLAQPDNQQTDKEGRKRCGECGEETWGETEMVNHWVTTCRELFNRQQSQLINL